MLADLVDGGADVCPSGSSFDVLDETVAPAEKLNNVPLDCLTLAHVAPLDPPTISLTAVIYNAEGTISRTLPCTSAVDPGKTNTAICEP